MAGVAAARAVAVGGRDREDQLETTGVLPGRPRLSRNSVASSESIAEASRGEEQPSKSRSRVSLSRPESMRPMPGDRTEPRTSVKAARPNLRGDRRRCEEPSSSRRHSRACSPPRTADLADDPHQRERHPPRYHRERVWRLRQGLHGARRGRLPRVAVSRPGFNGRALRPHPRSTPVRGLRTAEVSSQDHRTKGPAEEPRELLQTKPANRRQVSVGLL